MLIQNPEVTNKEYYGKLLPPQGFRPEAKSRGGILTVQMLRPIVVLVLGSLKAP